MAQMISTLSSDQQEQFLTRGHFVVPDCFSRDVAQEWTDDCFQRLGYDKTNPQTWHEPFVFIPATRSVQIAEFAPKAWAAICGVLGGEDRIVQPVLWSNGLIANFNLASAGTWQPPAPTGPSWHKDGNNFRNFLDSPEQALQVLVIWSDIQPHGGGTFIACDSVRPVAQYLNHHPEGVSVYSMSSNHNPDLIAPCRDLIEITGRAGDVVIMHPLLLHSVSGNHSGRARFISNPPVRIREPLNFNRSHPSDYSLVEQAILRALGVDRLDFQATAPRRSFNSADIEIQKKIGYEPNVTS